MVWLSCGNRRTLPSASAAIRRSCLVRWADMAVGMATDQAVVAARTRPKPLAVDRRPGMRAVVTHLLRWG